MIAIIDYAAGNTKSVMNALKRLNADFVLTDNRITLSHSDKVILPGVGHAGAAMEMLRKKGLDDVIQSLSQPFLGICVGMQLMYSRSKEGNTGCMGILPGEVVPFEKNMGFKVPHMGWNENLTKKRFETSVLCKFETFETYFVHSYYAPVNQYTVASCEYAVEFASVVNKDNYWGVQFHPEKSGKIGNQILKNFIDI